MLHLPLLWITPPISHPMSLQTWPPSIPILYVSLFALAFSASFSAKRLCSDAFCQVVATCLSVFWIIWLVVYFRPNLCQPVLFPFAPVWPLLLQFIILHCVWICLPVLFKAACVCLLPRVRQNTFECTRDSGEVFDLRQSPWLQITMTEEKLESRTQF